MDRYLLFDSGCALCAELARQIEEETGGWLTTRSLRDPQMQTLLDRAQPGWHWEPILLEVDGARVRVYTGLAMRTHMLLGLGLRRTWRVAEMVRQAGVPVSSVNLSRRRFLTLLQASALAGLLMNFLPISRVFADSGGETNNQSLSGATFRLPKNAKIEQLSGDEAQKVIQQALDHSHQLQAALPQFKQQTGTAESQARTVHISWVDEAGKRHEGPVAAIPFVNNTGTNAFLFFGAIDGNAQCVMSILRMDGQRIVGVDVHQIKNGILVKDQANINPTGVGRVSQASGTCTIDCLVWCVQAYGCSGLSVALCIAALLTCPFSVLTCIVVAYACALYCGGAWSICTTQICCAGV